MSLRSQPWLHLARRFFGSLRPGGPSSSDAAWVAALLSEAELGLWRRMSGADQRHAAGVAREVAAALPSAGGPVLVAALLHDVGKVVSSLSTFERALATVARDTRFATPRWQRYYDHPRVGAELLELAGSDPLVVAWAREHHLPRDRWTVPLDVADVLIAADDD